MFRNKGAQGCRRKAQHMGLLFVKKQARKVKAKSFFVLENRMIFLFFVTLVRCLNSTTPTSASNATPTPPTPSPPLAPTPTPATGFYRSSIGNFSNTKTKQSNNNQTTTKQNKIKQQ